MTRSWAAELELGLPRLVVAALVVALGVALALLPWQWALLLIAVPAVALALLIRPALALCLLAFAVPFGSIREWPLGPVNVGMAELLVLALGISWAAKMIMKRRLVIPQPPLFVPLILLLAAFSVSSLAATSLALSAREVVKWLEVLIIYLFMADRGDQRWGKWVVFALLIAGSLEALLGVYQFLLRVGPEGFLLFGRFMRAYGHFAQPNPFAGYLGLGVPLAYALGLQAAGSWGRDTVQVRLSVRQALSRVVRTAAPWAAFAVMLAAIVMSWSRGAWMGVAASLLVVTVARSKRALVIVLLASVLVMSLLGAGGAGYLPGWLVERFSGLVPVLSGVDVTRVDINDANWAVIERMAHWQAAIGMFADHPWLGVGIGNYSEAYAGYALGRWRDPLGHAHNYYLNVAAEAGIFGLAAYLTLIAAALAEAWRAVRRSLAVGSDGADAAYRRAVALGGLGILMHLVVHSLFDNLYVHGMNVQIGLVLGLLTIAQKDAVGDAHRV